MAKDMPLYQGTKTLRAKPMSKDEYCALRGWDVPSDEDPAESGYLVEYTDGGKTNVEGFDGYISWSPADVFERSYRPAETHIDRMRIEHGELESKIEKLHDFMQTNKFDTLDGFDQSLMHGQHGAMVNYQGYLTARLSRAVNQGAN